MPSWEVQAHEAASVHVCFYLKQSASGSWEKSTLDHYLSSALFSWGLPAHSKNLQYLPARELSLTFHWQSNRSERARRGVGKHFSSSRGFIPELNSQGLKSWCPLHAHRLYPLPALLPCMPWHPRDVPYCAHHSPLVVLAESWRSSITWSHV